MRDDFKPRADDVLPGIRNLRYKWIDTFLEWVPTEKIQGGSWVDGATGSAMVYDHRPQEDRERLMALRSSQDQGWDKDHDYWMKSLEWSDKQIGLQFSTGDPFEAKRVLQVEEEEDLQAIAVSMEKARRKGTLEATCQWDGVRVKATLRSGKMLPYDLLRRVRAQTNWTHIQKWIDRAGDLPDLAPEVLEAVREVRNQGYSDALSAILAGDVAGGNDPRRKQQDRACDLVGAILRGWEAQVAGPARVSPGAQTIEVEGRWGADSDE